MADLVGRNIVGIKLIAELLCTTFRPLCKLGHNPVPLLAQLPYLPLGYHVDDERGTCDEEVEEGACSHSTNVARKPVLFSEQVMAFWEVYSNALLMQFWLFAFGVSE